MGDITQKTVGTLIDELITTDLKCWFAQEDVMKETDPIKIAAAAKKAQETNARRNALIRAIDERLGESGNTQLGKTYA
jgi:hypothetical protein